MPQSGDNASKSTRVEHGCKESLCINLYAFPYIVSPWKS